MNKLLLKPFSIILDYHKNLSYNTDTVNLIGIFYSNVDFEKLHTNFLKI